MANEKTTKADKGIPKPEEAAPEATAKAAPKSYVVAFSGISDKEGKLRLKGETVTADELPDPDFQLSLGAIADVVEAVAEPATPEPTKPPEETK
jgi:G:T/U-mismatch repair DNA glycosylase